MAKCLVLAAPRGQALAGEDGRRGTQVLQPAGPAVRCGEAEARPGPGDWRPLPPRAPMSRLTRRVPATCRREENPTPRRGPEWPLAGTGILWGPGRGRGVVAGARPGDARSHLAGSKIAFFR